MDEIFNEWYELGSMIEEAKHRLLISKPNSELTDDEIKYVCRMIGQMAPDTDWNEKGEPIFGHEGIFWMIEVTIYHFPAYFSQMGLSQFN
jgi:hypothetical protein